MAAVVRSGDGSVVVVGVVTVESRSIDSDLEEEDETVKDDGGLGISFKRVLTRSCGVVILTNKSAGLV